MLVIALAIDLPKLDDTRDLEALYDDVVGHTGSAFKLELTAGVLLVLVGGLALMRERAAARVSAAASAGRSGAGRASPRSWRRCPRPSRSSRRPTRRRPRSDGVVRAIEIGRPLEEVFRFVADARNDPRWCRKVQSVEGGEPGMGARYAVVHKPVPGKPAREMEMTCVGCDAPGRIEWLQEDGTDVFRSPTRCRS